MVLSRRSLRRTNCMSGVQSLRSLFRQAVDQSAGRRINKTLRAVFFSFSDSCGCNYSTQIRCIWPNRFWPLCRLPVYILVIDFIIVCQTMIMINTISLPSQLLMICMCKVWWLHWCLQDCLSWFLLASPAEQENEV